jgi:hypothetical protein
LFIGPADSPTKQAQSNNKARATAAMGDYPDRFHIITDVNNTSLSKGKQEIYD